MCNLKADILITADYIQCMGNPGRVSEEPHIRQQVDGMSALLSQERASRQTSRIIYSETGEENLLYQILIQLLLFFFKYLVHDQYVRIENKFQAPLRTTLFGE